MRANLVTAARAAALAAAAVLAAGPSLAAPAQNRAIRLAASALGDLSSFRTIAVDTLALLRKGDIPGARARARDLETAWDGAEAGLKPKDRAAWTAIDGRIDEALADIRGPNPKPATCERSLGALLAELDAAGRA